MLDYAKDVAATNNAYKNGIFSDTKMRSYIDNLGHVHLRGKDRSWQRERLFYKVKGICATCGRFRDQRHGDMDHFGKTPKTRCECIDRYLNNGTVCTGIAWRCGMRFPNSCHRKRHNREPQFSGAKA